MICHICKNQYDIYNAVINGETGSWTCPDCNIPLSASDSSCITGNHKVKTPSGFKKIEDLAQGDLIKGIHELTGKELYPEWFQGCPRCRASAALCEVYFRVASDIVGEEKVRQIREEKIRELMPYPHNIKK